MYYYTNGEDSKETSQLVAKEQEMQMMPSQMDMLVADTNYPYVSEYEEECIRWLKEYIRKERKRLSSESNIFGVLTIHCKNRQARYIVNYMNKKGATIKYIEYEKPIRRNSEVRLVYYSREIGIINTPVW